MTSREGSHSVPVPEAVEVSDNRRREVWILARAVAFDDGVGGLERAVADQTRALVSLGWTVFVMTPKALAGTPPLGVQVHDVPWPRGFGPGKPGFGAAYAVWVRSARKALRREMSNGASLYAHGGAAGVLRGLNRSDIRSVVNPHGMEEFAKGNLLRWTNRVFTRWLARGAILADRVVATDTMLIDQVKSNLRTTNEQTVVIPNGIDVARLDALAARMGREGDGPDIVSVGRLVHNKGYDLLAQAMHLLGARTGRSLTWTHFGRGPLKSEVQRLADSSPFVQLEIIEGAEDEVVQGTLASARIFVQPSRYEGSSLTTLEAMVRGPVCVGTPVGGIPEKIIDGETGVLATEASADSIADALERADQFKSTDIGVRARSRVLEMFDLKAVAERLSSALEQPEGARPRVVYQIARHIGPGAGVAQVVYSLENAFRSLNVQTERVTLADTGLPFRTQIGRSARSKLLLLIEVLWFSIAGSLAIRRIRVRHPDAQILVHGDPVGGDVYVNHGLLKEVLRQRRKGSVSIPANPMHWFTLARDEVRYRSSAQSTIVCLTSRDEDVLRDLYPKVKSPIEIVPNGVDLMEYESLDAKFRDATRAELGLAPAQQVILFVGHEYERKGLFVLLEALTVMRTNAALLVVGGDRQMIAEGRAAAARLGVEERTMFVGATTDPRPYYAAADVFALPTSYETGPLVLLEALAAGRMTVMTDTGLAPEVLQDSRTGVIAARESTAFAQAIDRCFDTLGASRQPTIEACRSAARDFGWPAIAGRYLTVLDASRSGR